MADARLERVLILAAPKIQRPQGNASWSGSVPNGVMDPGLDEVLFSLAPGSPSLTSQGRSPADVLWSNFSGSFRVQVSADALGLLAMDNVDAIDVRPTLSITDCNCNNVDDDCDISRGVSRDCNGNAAPDECERWNNDCNCNDVPDECDIADGSSLDCNANAIPDECETDCNLNGIPDDCDLAAGTSQDCNTNGVPDECEPPLAVETFVAVLLGADVDPSHRCFADANQDGIPDGLDIHPFVDALLGG